MLVTAQRQRFGSVSLGPSGLALLVIGYEGRWEDGKMGVGISEIVRQSAVWLGPSGLALMVTSEWVIASDLLPP